MKIKLVIKESRIPLHEKASPDVIKQIAKNAGIDISKFDMNELIMGYETEKEHGKKDPETDITGNSPIKTLKIAIAHLKELPDYYTRLKKMERGGKN